MKKSIVTILTLMFLSTSAFAAKVIKVNGVDNLWVIVCDDNGAAYTFYGTQNGANDVSGILCPNGIADPNNTDPGNEIIADQTLSCQGQATYDSHEGVLRIPDVRVDDVCYSVVLQQQGNDLQFDFQSATPVR